MRKLFLAVLFAVIGASLIAGLYRPRPLEQQLLHLQVERSMPEHAEALAAEPPELQALFLMYADDPVLLAKARVSLLRYPQMARPLFAMYGADESFQHVLRTYGEDVFLPIHYFVNNPVFTIELMRSLGETARSAARALRGLWGDEAAGDTVPPQQLTAEERGRYAIEFIAAEGHDFLGQFVVSQDGAIGWVQTERVLEGINRFFAGGLKGLESKVRRDETLEAADYGWAAVDVAVGVGAFKLLRMGRGTAAAGRSLTFPERSAVLGAGLWRGTVAGARVARYGAPAILAYMAVRHPSLINSLLGSAAEKLGLPVVWVQIVGWTLVLLPVILVLRLFLAPLAWLLVRLAALLRWGDRAWRRRGRRALA